MSVLGDTEIAGRASVYRQWLEDEGLPVIRSHYVEDVREVPLAPWPRRGGLACFINHETSDRTNDCYVCEIPPGGSLRPQRHLFEEMIYVLSGRGATAVWYDEAHKQSFEWQEGSLFAVPLNAWHEHFNVSGEAPARFFAVTNAPQVINLFEDAEFVWQCPYAFTGRFSGTPDFFRDEGRVKEGPGGRIWETNFVADCRLFNMPGGGRDDELRRRRGFGVSGGGRFDLGKSTLGAHISEWEVGTYKKAHRHEAGAHVLILRGEGYSLLWPEGEAPKRYEWREGSLLIPPDQWFHQHFNVCAEPTRFLALRYLDMTTRFRIRNLLPTLSGTSRKEGGDQIEYEDEEPQVRQTYAAELAARDLALRMP